MKCNYKNPARSPIAQKCGAKMDFTADEIAGRSSRRREETAQNTEHYAKHTLTFARRPVPAVADALRPVVRRPEESYYVPALAGRGSTVRLEFKLSPEVKKLSIPIEIRKR